MLHLTPNILISPHTTGHSTLSSSSKSSLLTCVLATSLQPKLTSALKHTLSAPGGQTAGKDRRQKGLQNWLISNFH